MATRKKAPAKKSDATVLTVEAGGKSKSMTIGADDMNAILYDLEDDQHCPVRRRLFKLLSDVGLKFRRPIHSVDICLDGNVLVPDEDALIAALLAVITDATGQKAADIIIDFNE